MQLCFHWIIFFTSVDDKNESKASLPTSDGMWCVCSWNHTKGTGLSCNNRSRAYKFALIVWVLIACKVSRNFAIRSVDHFVLKMSQERCTVIWDRSRILQGVKKLFVISEDLRCNWQYTTIASQMCQDQELAIVVPVVSNMVKTCKWLLDAVGTVPWTDFWLPYMGNS